MKNIEITHDCFFKGEPVKAGDILENVENGPAAELLTSGRAKLATVTKAAPEPKKKAAKKASKKDEHGDSK